MNFSPDTTKQAHELIISHIFRMTNRPSLSSNQNVVSQIVLQKHLGMFLDRKENFGEHSEN